MIVVWVAVVVAMSGLLGGVTVGMMMLAAQRSAETTSVRLAVETRKMLAGVGEDPVPLSAPSRRVLARRALPAGRSPVYDE